MNPETKLAAPGATLAELMAALAEVEPPSRRWRVGVSANITTEPASTYFRRRAHLAGLACEWLPGDHDAHLANVRGFVEQGVDTLLLVSFFAGLAPGFEARPDAARLETWRGELRLALEAARPLPDVVVLRPHRFGPAPLDGRDAAAAAIAAFDAALLELVPLYPNVRLVDTAGLVAALGREAALSPRRFYSHAAPYTPAFWDALARKLLAGREGRKVLVLDGDGTLWGGVLGEDGALLDPHAHPGNVFWEVQQRLVALQERGALLVLRSKNEPGDLEAMLARGPLTAERFVLVRHGWGDKPGDIRAVAAELELGLESFAFLDDSPFECEAVRGQLPEVAVFQVPERLWEYPALLEEIVALFPEDSAAALKTAQYRARAAALAARAKFANEAEYLASLGLRVTVRRDDASQVPRLVELARKTNQFNTTTRRYGAAELEAAIADPGATVYALSAADRFGDAGLIGLALVRWEPPVARVESFMLSCRMLGRGIELSPWALVLADALARGCTRLVGEYAPSSRNTQVADFWSRLGIEDVAAPYVPPVHVEVSGA